MSVSIADYSHDRFNSLNDFNPALRKFDSIDGSTLVGVTLKKLFRRHGVEDTLGLTLLHKHSKLYQGERLTDVRGTSHPLSFKLGQPSIWGFGSDAHGLVPLEFSTTGDEIDWQTDTIKRFLAELYEVLAENEATDILGLCPYPGDGYPGRVEFTLGRSNVNLTPYEVSLWRFLQQRNANILWAMSMPLSSMREAAWFYTEDFMKRGCKCNCFIKNGHTHSHGYTT